MKVPHIIGADLSKKTIDFASHQLRSDLQIENNASGFKNLLQWLQHLKINPVEIMIVMEHTGLYTYKLEQFLHHRQIMFTKVSALAIKRSMGLVRGKSDKQDARRIARYGFEKFAELTAAKPVDKNLQRLQMLHSIRERLVRTRAGYLTTVKEYRHTLQLAETDVIIATQLRLIKVLQSEIKKIDQQIESLVTQDQVLHQNYQLLKSIKGVGKVLAVAALVKTQNFTRFATARKFACFCGTAPFEHTSGTSIHRKTKVSHLADKQMKTLLELGARSAIQYDKELREYYLNRIEKGKSKEGTINIVRNKIIYRMFAVIKRQTAYQPLQIASQIFNPTLKN